MTMSLSSIRDSGHTRDKANAGFLRVKKIVSGKS